MFNIIYNNKSSEDVGVWIVQRPNVPAPEERITEYEITGRDGVLSETDDTFYPIEIEVPMNYVSRQFAREYRKVKRWLIGPVEDNKLFFSDDMAYFYKVIKVTMGTNERTLKKLGVFNPVFRCDPYMYRVDGTYEYDPEEVLWNPYLRSRPTFLVSGNGDFTIKVNGITLRVTIYGNIVIDTDQLEAYRDGLFILADSDGARIIDSDGVSILISQEVSRASSHTSGSFDEIWLEEGENTITYTEGFDVKVIPNWRVL